MTKPQITLTAVWLLLSNLALIQTACPSCDNYTDIGNTGQVCGVDGITYATVCELLVALCEDGTISIGDGIDVNAIPIGVIVAQYKANSGPCVDSGGDGNCPNCTSVVEPIPVCDSSLMEYDSACMLAKTLCDAGIQSYDDGIDFSTMTEDQYRDKIDGYVSWNGMCSGPCAQGEFSTSGDYGPCRECAPGSIAPNTGSKTCNLCMQNTYQPEAGKISCISCPAGSETLADGATSAAQCLTDCLVGHYSANGKSPCTQCSPGSFADATGSTQCSLCDRDSYEPSSGSSACLPCPGGTDTVAEGSTDVAECISDCVEGHYSANGKAPCTKCSAGTWTNVAKATFCQGCGAGKFSSGNACSGCPLGQFSNSPNVTACIDCSIGKYSNVTGSTNCTSCGPGTFQNTTGGPACKLCDSGTYNNVTGGTSCDSCDAGHYQIELGKTFCFTCPKGTYQNKTGQEVCPPCEKSSYQDVKGGTSCTKCPEGQITDSFASISKGECHFTECKTGSKVVIISGRVTCESCLVGHYQNRNNQTSCKECPFDTYQDSEGSISCKKCPENHVTYKDGEDNLGACEGPAITLATGRSFSGYSMAIYDKRNQMPSNLKGKVRSFKVTRGDWYVFSGSNYGGRKLRIHQGTVRSDVNDGTENPKIGYMSSGAFYAIRPVVSDVMCYVQIGFRYEGYRSKTQKGTVCQNWKSKTPHSSISTFTGQGIGNHNYCRNPDNDPNGPWCYTTDPNRLWDYCGVPKCIWNVDCYTELGEYYRGTRTKTAGNDYNCNDWYSNFPHPHSFDNAYNDEHYGTGRHRYCRNPNPGGDNRPWCYTTYFFQRWAYCDVPKCEFSSSYSYFKRDHDPK